MLVQLCIPNVPNCNSIGVLGMFTVEGKSSSGTGQIVGQQRMLTCQAGLFLPDKSVTCLRNSPRVIFILGLRNAWKRKKAADKALDDSGLNDLPGYLGQFIRGSCKSWFNETSMALREAFVKKNCKYCGRISAGKITRNVTNNYWIRFPRKSPVNFGETPWFLLASVTLIS